MLSVNFLYSQPSDDSDNSGEEAIALRYTEWAEKAIAEGRLTAAETFLTQAADYANVSSDLSYQRAYAGFLLHRPKRGILASLNLAFVTDRWNKYTKEAARLLEAEILIEMKQYAAALRALDRLGFDEKPVLLRLRALLFSNNVQDFKKLTRTALERYPDNPDFAVLFLKYAKNVPAPDAIDNNLIDIILKRVYILQESYPNLAYLAAPFMRDTEEARRNLQAWVAAIRDSRIPAEALPVLLKLGVMDEEGNIESFFYSTTGNTGYDRYLLYKDDIEAFWQLIRTDDLRLRFEKNISKYSGTIVEDSNGDGIVETQTEYKDGLLLSFIQDRDQDGENEIVIAFKAGVPVSAEIFTSEGTEEKTPEKYFVTWSRYPALRDAVVEGAHYFFRSGEFFYKPFQFINLCGGEGGLLYPLRNSTAGLSETSIVSASYYFERAGKDFDKSVEKFECSGGIILSSKEYLNGELVSVSEYKNGIIVKQRIDLDLDGRLETVRHYKNNSGVAVLDYIEGDWNGDNYYEYRENF
ncbi:hypothetical protein FACS1894190_14770 [Spirochaetia bacterium]|nr:hypothetical protein FACS1894190_14770 [Spirochaetia bacterium]